MEHPAAETRSWPRRRVMALLAALGTGAAFSRELVSLAAGSSAVTEKMVRRAEWLSGIAFDADERRLMLDGVNDLLADVAKLREVELDNSVPPAVQFRPPYEPVAGAGRGSVRATAVSGSEPATDEDLAYASVPRLASLLRQRKISSAELTRLYLDRLGRFDPELHCVIHLVEEAALDQARRADEDLAAGRDRGPLHGIPWGAKDLLAVPGAPTTWGARPFQEQVRPEHATVASRLDEAGAVLVAKLTLGALAWGDVWFGGKTRNPWNAEQGSSGSSAGPAAATAAGLVGFAIGSETWGSIVSPCTRCGVTGLRPTFGAVSRFGAMALAWSMDKLGPIARGVEDCALIFDAIRGKDGLDPTVVDRPFDWPLGRDRRSLKIGYVEELFEEDRTEKIEDEKQRERAREWQRFDRRTLDTLRELGLRLVPVELPDSYPVEHMPLILTAEASAAFDRLTRDGRDDLLVRQIENAWPNVFRQGQLIPAVEYLRANRIRSLVVQELEEMMATIDLYVCPSFGGHNLLMTNLTGHPCVVLPNGFTSADGTPTSITFNGRLHGETEMLAVAHAYQQATDYHLQRPPVGRET